MNPLKRFWNWKTPKDSSWVPYVLIIVCILILAVIVAVPYLT